MTADPTEPTRLVLVRHGHTPANGSPGGMRMSGWTDTPLSERGRREATLVANALGGRPPFAALYSSPLQRARHTAEEIEAAVQEPIRIEPGLREISCGEVDGRTIEHVRLHHAPWWARNAEELDEEFRWPGGESYREFRARCLRTVRALVARHRGQRVLVVTHAGFISQVLGSIAGVSCARWSSFRPRNASLSVLDWSVRSRRVIAFDEHAHLEELAPTRATPLRPAG